MLLLRASLQRGACCTSLIVQQSRQVPKCYQRWHNQAAAVPKEGKKYSRAIIPALAGLSLLAWYSTAIPLQADEKKRLPPKEVAPVAAQDPQGKLISMEEVSQHDSLQKGIWVAIEGQVYDITTFVNSHPGGKNVILKHAGKDVTELYMPVHPANAIEENLKPSQCLGQVDPSTVKVKQDGPESEKDRQRREARENLPVVGSLLNLDDFERVAKTILSDQAWAYYSSAGDDEVSKHQNRSSYSRIWFRPRILRAVEKVDASTTLLDGSLPSSLPIFISPAALAKLGHPDGELNLTRAAGKAGIVHGISANSSVSLEELLDARQQHQPVFYQMYVNKDRSASERILEKIQEKGVSALILTVDAPVMGKRERDMRIKGEVVETGGGQGGQVEGGVGSAISGYFDANLSWKDIAWLKQKCSLPLFLKGVGTVADVDLAVKHGCQGVILSNHGGRELDFAPAPIDVLIELRQTRPDLFNKIEVYIDGGVRRGTDVLKALALGATAVGLGRPFLYAQSGYGEAGAARAIQIMRDEIERGMRLLGVTSLKELDADMIDILPRSYDPFIHAKRKQDLGED